MALLLWLLPPGLAAAFFAVQMATFGVYMGAPFAPNHKGMPIPAVDLHGDLSQGARARNLAAFTSGAAMVLVATDIAARGIHVDDVDLVVHVDPPTEHEAYLHRYGRTARAGSSGRVVTVALPAERADVRNLTRAAGISASPQRVDVAHATVTALAGATRPARSGKG